MFYSLNTDLELLDGMVRLDEGATLVDAYVDGSLVMGSAVFAMGDILLGGR
jgi:hypothetical protein